jgi:CO/xanthine dehydrogenase Mo-binding subunit
MEEALGQGAVFKRFEILKGNLLAGFREADEIVLGEYRVPHQEQAYIEPNGVAAWEEPDGTLVIMGSLQCPYYVHKAMLGLFPRAPEKIRVIQTVTGGGFGGKEEYPNLIAGHAAVLALKAKRPVKIVYDRAEDMRATTKRHPARIRHRTGVKKDGTLVAQDIDVLMDGGAYITLSPVVLSRGVLHATGHYECPNVRVSGAVVKTNTPPNGAFRGFGAPQTLFAAEMQVEKIAARLRLDPLSVRKKNLFREGSVTATEQVLKESVGAEAVLDRVVASSGYWRRKKVCESWNRRRSAPSFRGVGLAAVFHGDGFTGSGEVYLQSRAAVALLPDGEVEVEAASTEIGQGTTSILAAIAADALEIPYEWVRVSTPDTARVPNSGPTVASRTCMIVGGLLKRSAEALRRALEREGVAWPPTPAALKRAARKLCANGRPFGFVQEYERPSDIKWDDQRYRGDAYGVYSYAAMLVEADL